MGHFQTIRFHKATGPASLFARVKQIMGVKTGLKIHGLHFKRRANERNIDKQMLADFPSELWELMEAEVRSDTGKFVSSSWRKSVDNQYLWIVVGFGETVKTAFWSNGYKLGPSVERESSIYFFVAEANQALLDESATVKEEKPQAKVNVKQPYSFKP
jgi:hypothetical protein